jgi:hypothetical protein
MWEAFLGWWLRESDDMLDSFNPVKVTLILRHALEKKNRSRLP